MKKILVPVALFSFLCVFGQTDLTDRGWRPIKHEAPPQRAELQKKTAEGETVWQVDADYSKGGKACGMELTFEPAADIGALSFRLRTPAKIVGVCAVDSSGQGFLRLYPLSGSKDFVHRLEVERFDAPPGARFFWHWGGQNDGTFRPPLKKLQLKTFGDSGPAGETKWSDQYMQIIGRKSSAALSTENRKLAEPGEFSDSAPDDSGDWRLLVKDWPTAAEGKLEQLPDGVLAVTGDFSNGGTLLGVSRAFYGGIRANGMSFEIKTPVRKIFVEVQDFRRQVFYQSLPLSGNGGEWQRVTVDAFHGSADAGFQWYGGFDGPTGKFRYPAETVSLLWNNGSLKGAVETRLRDFHFRVPAAPALAVKAPSELLAYSGKVHAPAFRLHAAPGKIREVAYQVSGYAGKLAAEGKVPVDGVNFRVPMPVERGFYEILFPEFGTVYGYMVLDEPAGEPDPYFMVDTNFAVNRRTESEMISDEYLKILARAGIRSVHDRTLWRILEPERGKFRWNNRNADTLHRLYEKHKFKVLDSIDGAPRWTGSAPERNEEDFFPYPRDLAAAGESVGALLKRYAAFRDGIEVWNEPENSFGAWMPGDQVTAFQKLLVYEKSKPGTGDYPVIGGAMTGNVISPRLMKNYCGNGMIGNSDIFSFHTYHGAESMVGYIRNFRDMISFDPNGTLPFWVTEGGMGWTGGENRAPAGQDRFIAAQIAMKAIECKASGIGRFSIFTVPYYEEPPANFGLFDANHSPHRHLFAFLNLARVLRHAEYLGDLAGSSGAVINRVFAGDGGAVIVAYSGRWPGEFAPPAGLKVDRGETIDGRRLMPESGKWPISDGLVYLYCGLDAVKPFLHTGTEAMRQREIARGHRPRRLPVKPGILSFDFLRKKTTWTHEGYRFGSAIAELPVRFNNAGDKTLFFVPELQLPPGAKLLADFPSKSLEVPPGASKIQSIKVDLSGCFPKGDPCDLTVSDRNGSATPLVIGLIPPGKEVLTAEVLPETFRLPERFDSLGGWLRLDDGRKFWKQWEGPMLSNVRVALRAFYTPDKIRLIVLADEKVFHQPYRNFDVWRADSVQIGLRKLDNVSRRASDFSEYCIADTADGPIVLRSRVESPSSAKAAVLTKSKLAFDRVGTLSRYVIDLDRAECELPEFKSGTKIGFSFLVNNSEGEVRDGYIFWGGGIGDVKSAEAFQELELR